MTAKTTAIHPILIVDDESGIVTSLARLLEGEAARISTFTDPLAALAAIQQQHYSLILSDNLMPRLTGLKLLTQARELSPHTRRVLITGYTDADTAIEAFNQRIIHRYLHKPWDKGKLLSVVREELAIYTEEERRRTAQRQMEIRSRRRSQMLANAIAALQEEERGAGITTDTRAVTHRLAALLIGDVVGYSRLMSEDSMETLRLLNERRRVWQTEISRVGGHLVNAPGDSILAEFESALDAVQCALAVQQEFQRDNQSLPPSRQMHFRVGITVGEVLDQGGDLYGEGVNIAARLQSMADPGSICVSENVYRLLRPSTQVSMELIGERALHNIPDPVRAYRVVVPPQGQRDPTPDST